jgi:UDP-N-acetylmuramoyl-tripeptide--D-alanyl-D-alanine ligase
MSAWTGSMVAAALALGTRVGDDDVTFTGVATDTRMLRGGELFVALVGENHDGHDYLAAAAAAGARGAVVQRLPDDSPEALHTYRVPDTLDALGRLGRFRRRRLGARVCAITGTNGKTTTKDLLRAILTTRYRTHATAGNFNNLVGAPLTLLAAPDDTEAVIAEVGTNAPGEIARLAAIVEPDAAIITGIAAGHLEGLGDVDGVLREKTSLLTWLPVGAPAVVADGPESLPARARVLADGVAVAGTGAGADAALRGEDVTVDEEGRVRFRWAGRDVRLRLRGRHNARNALLALALGRAWGVADAAAIEAIEGLDPPKMRAEVHRYGSVTVIADCYNANPGSVDAAVDLLASMPRQGGRIAVLGSMLELGHAAEAIHRATAVSIAERDLDLIVATGMFANAFAPLTARLGEHLIAVADPADAWAAMEPRLTGDEVVLLKGSRGVALERLLPRFEEQWGVPRPHGEAFGPRGAGTGAGAGSTAASREHTRNGSSTGTAGATDE